MRILFCSPGIKYQAHALRYTILRAGCMADAGLDVLVLGYPPAIEMGVITAKLPYEGIYDSIIGWRRRVVDRCSRGLGNYWRFIAEPFMVQWTVLRSARRRGFDLVYVNDMEPWILLVAMMLGGWARRGLPVVGFVPYVFYDASTSRVLPWPARLRGVMNQHACRFLMRWMDIVCDNRHVPGILGLKPSSRLHLVPDGFVTNAVPSTSKAEARQRLGMPQDRRVLLLFGSASKAKGADFLLRALDGLKPLFDVWIVGKTGGVYEDSWGDTAGLFRTGWTGHLQVISRYVSEQERADLFAACDGVVLPYRRGFATSSGPLRDAVENSKALLVSDQYELGEFVKVHRLGLTFPPEDIGALRQCLEAFAGLSDTELQEIAENCKHVVESDSWNNIGLRFRSFFEALLERKQKN